MALGDSITWGLAASKTCQPQVATPVETSCPDGTSFTAVLARALHASGRSIRIQNVAISGARVSWILADEIKKIAPDVNLITVFVGANDFSDIAFRRGSLADFEHQYSALVAYVVRHFPEARIVLVNVPNVGYLPCCGDTRGQGQGTWQAGNAFIDSFANRFSVVDLVCDATLYQAAMFPAQGGIHPGDVGHARIAADIMATLRHPRKPAASCPPYF